MKRISRIISAVSGIVNILSAVSCAKVDEDFEGYITVVADCGRTRTYDSDTENGIWDLNLFITGENGRVEYHKYTEFDGPGTDPAVEKFRLIYGRKYEIYAIANAGYNIGAPNAETLDGFKLHLIYPDHFERGFPMAVKKSITAEKGVDQELRLERLVSKLSVRLDRSALDPDISFYIAGARVGNSPKWVRPFSDSKAENPEDDFFPSGFYAYGGDNIDIYLAENMQGELKKELCSYLEMDVDYSSGSYYTEGDNCLKYRFYIREEDGYCVKRNSHYRVVVRPEKDGLLCDDSWRVDKSGLLEWSGDPYLRIMPEGSTVDGTYYEHYYEMDRLSSLHFSIASFPAKMKIWLREDLVQDEMEDGRAEYIMDADGHGFTVKSLGIACTSMMEIHAGSPLDDYIMICVCVR